MEARNCQALALSFVQKATESQHSFLPCVLPSFLPAILSSCSPSFLPPFLPPASPSCLPFFLPSFVPAFLPSFLPSFLSCFVPSFLLSFRPFFVSFYVFFDASPCRDGLHRRRSCEATQPVLFSSVVGDIEMLVGVISAGSKYLLRRYLDVLGPSKPT